MSFWIKPTKLHPCLASGMGSGAELFLVEGDSASKSVYRIRDQRFQAVLPMQGKPMNTLKAKRDAIAASPLFRVLIDTLGCGWGDDLDLSAMKYDRVILLFDPDADGIHCGALMLMFFHRWQQPLLKSGRIEVARAPLCELTSPAFAEPIYGYTDDHIRRLDRELKRRGITQVNKKRFRGLGGMDADILSRTCVDPAFRRLEQASVADAEAAIAAFSP